MDLIVGTFNTHSLYTLRFQHPHPLSTTSSGTLEILKRHEAIGSHSWLALSPSKRNLYATAWTSPPSVAAYTVNSPISLTLLNNATVAARSGYVAVSETHLYSAGGPTGDVFELEADGSIGARVQELNFVEEEMAKQDGEKRPHGDFGGLRHGAHSVDLSPDGKKLYIADIGRNCVWAYSVNHGSLSGKAEHLELGGKWIAPRATDGPRHTTPHPNGKVLYSLQEHTSMVDAFSIGANGTELRHLHGVKIIPQDKDPGEYWADEVRVSNTSRPPKWLYASTRGLKKQTKGYVAAFKLAENGHIGECLDTYETETSGGWANAVEPAPRRGGDGNDDDKEEWLALTDSEDGFVFILGFDGRNIREVARVKLESEGGEEGVVGAATAVWL